MANHYADLFCDCHIEADLFTSLHFYRDIIAERFFSHIIPVNRIGSCPTASANVNEFTFSALPLVGLEVAQVPEYL